MTWSSFISLYVSLKKSTRPRFFATGTSTSLPFLSAFLISRIPGIFMRPSSRRRKPQIASSLSLPSGGYPSNMWCQSSTTVVNSRTVWHHALFDDQGGDDGADGGPEDGEIVE